MSNQYLLASIMMIIFSIYSYPTIETCKGPLKDQPFCDERLPITERVNDVIERMDLNEKISIVDCLSRPAPPKRFNFANFQYPCEALHGLWLYVCNRDIENKIFPTSFPQVINLGRTFDFENIKKAAQYISDEGRALNNAGYMDICYWSPNINIFRDPRWGRGQEGKILCCNTPLNTVWIVAGEDPYLISEYAATYINGLQVGEDSKYLKVIAGAKHFTAYDLERWGGTSSRRFNAIVSAQDLEETFNPPFRSAVQRGKVLQVMCSYNAVNGIPSCASDSMLQRMLREEMEFEGWVVSDCGAIQSIADDHNYTKNYVEATAVSMNAGTDVNCKWTASLLFRSNELGGAIFLENIKEALDQGLITNDRIDESVRRILSVRMRTGEFDDWSTQYYKTIPISVVGCEKHTNLSCLLARESMILLKNKNDALPLSKEEIGSLAFLGPFMNATHSMQGDYSSPGPFWRSPWEGITKFIDKSKVHALKGCEVKGHDKTHFSEAVHYAQISDVTVLLMGIDTSVESEGRDRDELTFPGVQEEFIETVSANAKGKVILVKFGGGAIDLTYAKENLDAIIDAGLPSMCGGEALAKILFGEYSPTGRLTTTIYPQEYAENCNFTKMQMRPSKECPDGRTYKFYTGKPVFEFGDGLSYSDFKYEWENPSEEILVEKNEISDIKFVVNVTNIGERDAGNVILAFIKNTFNNDAPIRQLFGVKKIFLKKGEMTTVYFDASEEAFQYIDKKGVRTVENGKYEIVINDSDVTKTVEII